MMKKYYLLKDEGKKLHALPATPEISKVFQGI